jgi:hypothetical protein
MDLFGLVPIMIGILYVILAFVNIEWLMKNKGDFLIKILGRKGVRAWLAVVGIFFLGTGLFILLSG